MPYSCISLISIRKVCVNTKSPVNSVAFIKQNISYQQNANELRSESFFFMFSQTLLHTSNHTRIMIQNHVRLHIMALLGWW